MTAPTPITRIRPARHLRTERPPAPPVPLTVEETAAARAALYVTGLWGAVGQVPPIPVTAWTGHFTGAAVARLTEHANLIHTPGGENTNLTAHIDCPGGERHDYTITWPTDLDAAIATAAACTTDHDSAEPLDPSETPIEGYPYTSPKVFTLAALSQVFPHASQTAADNTAAALATVRRIHPAGN